MTEVPEGPGLAGLADDPAAGAPLTGHPDQTGQLAWRVRGSRGTGGPPDPRLDHSNSRLVTGEDEGEVPPNPLWAMKSKRRTRWRLFAGRAEVDPIRSCVGSGDDAIYAIDDGGDHALIARCVGTSASGCEYSLVARIGLGQFDALRAGELSPGGAFEAAQTLWLCGEANAEDPRTASVIDVTAYRTYEEVPVDYRPGSPLQQFAEDLDSDAY